MQQKKDTPCNFSSKIFTEEALCTSVMNFTVERIRRLTIMIAYVMRICNGKSINLVFNNKVD